MERKYSVSEIEDLRRVVEHMYLFGSYTMLQQGGSSRTYYETEKAKVVEEQVRTWMLAGVTADDLRKSEWDRNQNRGVDSL